MIFDLLAILIIVSYFLAQGRHVWRRFRSRNWPSVTATIQEGALGAISFPLWRGQGNPSAFFGYAFLVQGARRAGLFAVYGTQDGEILHDLLARLPGESVEVRYDPSDPDNSYLVDIHDPRFQGLTVTQNADRLRQVPEFHIGSLMK